MEYVWMGLAYTIAMACLMVVITSKQKVINKQHDTIQRLINREPVTYQEVGKEAPGPKYERYSAWSGQTIDIRDD